MAEVQEKRGAGRVGETANDRVLMEYLGHNRFLIKCQTCGRLTKQNYRDFLSRKCRCVSHRGAKRRRSFVIGDMVNGRTVVDCVCGVYALRCSLCGFTARLPRSKVLKTGCQCESKRRVGQSNHRFSGHRFISGSLLSRIKSNARTRGVEFNVSPDYLCELYERQGGRCALTGQEIAIVGSTDALKGLMTASLDRIDSSRGYIEGNLQWVHKEINKIKLDLPQDRFIELCSLVAKKKSAVLVEAAEPFTFIA